jgi:hypothetical protein
VGKPEQIGNFQVPMAITITFTFQDQDREIIGIVLSYSVLCTAQCDVLRGGTIFGSGSVHESSIGWLLFRGGFLNLKFRWLAGLRA